MNSAPIMTQNAKFQPYLTTFKKSLPEGVFDIFWGLKCPLDDTMGAMFSPDPMIFAGIIKQLPAVRELNLILLFIKTIKFSYLSKT